jgi:cation diffusion facilitator CzcD-associated flavoprotein CzcO
MPEHYPEFPHHRQVLEYLRGYARQFGLEKKIEFRTAVERLEPLDAEPHAVNAKATDSLPTSSKASGWRVTLAGGAQRHYRGVVIANGHNWDPRLPELPGTFNGTRLHSSQYKTPEVLRGKRVLVVGGGNSGVDLAVEASHHAEQAYLSLRRGYHVLPKFFKGQPVDQCGERLLKLRLPIGLRRLGAAMMIRWVLGPAELAGLPKPDHRLFESHPIINSRLHDRVAHGQLGIRPDVQALCGDQVRFVDGTSEPIDVLLFATGFRLSFPFLETEHLNWQEGRPSLFLNVFHPERDDLFCAGLIQPDSGQWGLVDYQAQLISKYLLGLDRNSRAARRLRQQKRSTDPRRRIAYLDSPRHRLEVEHFHYRRQLQKLIARLA